MSQRDPDRVQAATESEGESVTAGPGVVATKSQMQGAVGGAFIGGIVGALLGLIVGLIFFDGTAGIVIAAVAFGFAGAVFASVAGGFVRPRQKLEDGEADT